MKEIYVVLALLVLILTACGTSTQPTVPADTIQEATAIANIVSGTQTAQAVVTTPTSLSATSVRLTTEYENAAPVPMQLIIGILKLEGTDLAVTSSQAESLISLLSFLQDLSTNTSATHEQIDSLVEQTQSILTSEQIAAIANMKITQATAMRLMQEQGMAMGNPPVQGDMPQGTPPAGAPGGQPPSAGQMGTPPAGGMQPNMGFVPPPLLDMFIRLMESKTTTA